MLKFQRTDGAPIFETKNFASPALIVYASTGSTVSTTEVVGDVRAKRDENRPWFDDLFARYMALCDEAGPALQACDWVKMGELANRNHVLLQELSVSCSELDALVLAARDAGALGAKMSGTGRGGLMWAICADAESQDRVHAALSKIAPQVWKTAFA